MEQISKTINSTNINTIVTIIGIIVGIPGFILLTDGYMTLTNGLIFIVILLIVLISLLMYANRVNIMKYHNAENETRQRNTTITILNDQVANWQDKSSMLGNELREWQEDCTMLFDIRTELMLEIQRLHEELQRIYEKESSLDPKRTSSYSMNHIRVPSTPRDSRLVEIHRRLRELNNRK